MEDDAPIQQGSRTDFVSSFFHQIDHYKKLVFKYWWIPVLLAGGGVEIQSHLLKKVPPLFISVGKMIVNGKVTLPNENVYSEPVNDFYGTQMTLMKSDKVVNQVKARLRATHPELEPHPVEVAVSLEAKTTIFDLQGQGEDPVYTQLYLQGVMDEYINLKKEQLESVATSTQSSMIKELNRLDGEVQASIRKLQDFQSSNSVVLLQGGNSAADNLALKKKLLEDYKSDLSVQNSLTLDENLQRLLDQNSRKPGVDSPSNTVPRQDETTQGQDGKNLFLTNESAFSQIPANLGEFETAYLAQKRQLVKLNVNLKEAEDAYAKNPLSIDKSNAVEFVKTEIAHTQVELDSYKQQSEEQMTNRIHTLEVKIQDMENQVRDAASNATVVEKILAEYKTLQENHERLQSIYDQLKASLQKLEMTAGLSQESITIYEPACAAYPIPPSKMKHLVMAGMIGLVLGIGIMVFLDRLDDRPTSYSEVEKLFDLPVVGQFPLVKPKTRKEGVTILQLDDERYPMVESYRSLRSAILYRDSRKEFPRKIIISSARPGEGKSMVSANFAVTLAQAGARVLLVDADLRRGGLHKHFSVTATPGLSEVLSGHCAWADAAVQTSIPNLMLLPCGAYPRHPGNLFAKAAGFLEQIAGHYDFYLFDTPPIMVGDDVLSLAPQMDGLILVIRAGFTPGRMARTALDLLKARQVNVVGLAFNGVSPKSSDYHYYKFKDYYPQHPTA
jgi:capsular exopolysaccharide synthesis family protein